MQEVVKGPELPLWLDLIQETTAWTVCSSDATFLCVFDLCVRMKTLRRRPGSSTTQTCPALCAYSRLFCLWRPTVDTCSVVSGWSRFCHVLSVLDVLLKCCTMKQRKAQNLWPFHPVSMYRHDLSVERADICTFAVSVLRRFLHYSLLEVRHVAGCH